MDLRNLLPKILSNLPFEPAPEEVAEAWRGPGERDLTLQNIGKFISLMESEQGKNLINKSKRNLKTTPISLANSFLRTRYPQFAGRVPIHIESFPSSTTRGEYTTREAVEKFPDQVKYPYIGISDLLSEDPAVAAMSHEMTHSDQDIRGEVPPYGKALQPGNTKESFQAYLNQPHEVGARRQSDLAVKSWETFKNLIERAPLEQRMRYYKLLAGE